MTGIIRGRMTGLRVTQIQGNKPVSECIGGKACNFRSILERNWAAYLNFLKEQGEIADWEYEKTTYYFTDELKGAKMWLMDFDVYENDGTMRHDEPKGYLRGSDTTKFIRLARYKPGVLVDLVMMGRGQAAAVARIAKKKSCRRVVYARDIFRQIRGFVHLL